MPIYEYRCENCGHELEKLQKISDAPLKKCPVCDVDSLKKKVSAAAFRLKGGGWYETDFKSGNKKNLAGDGGAKKTESDNTGASKEGDKKAKSGDKSSTSGSSSSNGAA